MEVTVENIPGAAYMRSYADLMSREPDGHTIAATSPPGTGLPVFAMEDDPEVPMDEFEVVCYTDVSKYMAWANAGHGVTDYGEIIEKYQNDEWVNIGGQTPGTVNSLCVLTLRSAHGVEWEEFLSYSGGGEIAAAFASGEAPFGVTSPTPAAPFVDDGEVNPVVALHSSGSDLYPDTPTLDELGYENIDPISQFVRGYLAPPGTPDERLDTLASAFREAWESDEFQQWAEESGNAPMEWGGREEMADQYYGAIDLLEEEVDLELLEELMDEV